MAINTAKAPIVFIDADNTLWDTDAVYANAQLMLLGEVEKVVGERCLRSDRLEFVREFDQAIAERHKKHLRYPHQLLVLALGLGLSGKNPSAAAREVISGQVTTMFGAGQVADHLAQEFAEHINAKPKLREGVRVGLEKIVKKGYPIIVVTEGRREKCQELLKFHGIEGCIERVIEGAKHFKLYRRLSKLGKNCDAKVMIGDQLDRDIVPAKKAGLTTIYFPGNFQPKWQLPEFSDSIDFQITSLDEVDTILDDGRFNQAARLNQT